MVKKKKNPAVTALAEHTAQSLAQVPVQQYIMAATSDHTRRAYQSDVRQFIAWGGQLPCHTENIVAYLHAQANKVNPRTLQRYIVSLRQWHVTQGFADPTHHPLIKKTLTGIARTHGKPKVKAPAFTLDAIQRINQMLLQGALCRDVRDRALLLVGFFGAFRRSELVAINIDDITFFDEGVEIMVPRSKTDQTGEGRTCAIPKETGSLCPVTALQQWLAYLGETGPVFRRITKTDDVLETGFTGQQVSLIVKRLAKMAALANAEAYSGHSLRSGFATQARRQGADLVSIMRQGRWQSERTVMGYIEAGDAFAENAAGVILKSSD